MLCWLLNDDNKVYLEKDFCFFVWAVTFSLKFENLKKKKWAIDFFYLSTWLEIAKIYTINCEIVECARSNYNEW